MMRREVPPEHGLAGRSTAKPTAAHTRLGWKGALRLIHLLVVFTVFATRVWLNRRPWLGRHRKLPPALRQRQEGTLLRDILVALGPTFIKIGQMLATRLDLLPVQYLQALASLQDAVPPFPTGQARAIIADELGSPLETVFADFPTMPIAAASLAQVYRAHLHTGQTVAVKVQRPELAAHIALDMAVLHRLVWCLTYVSILPCTIDWQGMLEEFYTTILTELDYRQEVQHAERFRRHFARWPDVYVPRFYPEYSTSRVLVMEYIAGLKVTETAQLTAAGHDPRRIVTRLVRTYLKQVFEDGFFHADPHPGNLRVMDDGRLAFFDFGMVGQLPQTRQSALLEAFLHLLERDVSGLLKDLGRLGLLTCAPEAAMHVQPILEAVFEQLMQRHLGEMPFQALLFELTPMLAALPVQIPAHFAAILRALMTLEGIGMIIDPYFNLVAVARPYALRYTLLREGRYWSNLLLTRVLWGEAGTIDWDQLWTLAKLGWAYLRGRAQLR